MSEETINQRMRKLREQLDWNWQKLGKLAQ